MKKINLILLPLLMSVAVYGQTIIEKPRIGLSTASSLSIVKIELGDSATTLHFRYTAPWGYKIAIPRKTFIQPLNDTGKLFIVATEGIAMGKSYTIPDSGVANYKLIFPKINKSTRTIDYGEADGTWFIYDIQLKPSANIATLPQEFVGSWLNQTTGNWELSLFDTLAVYKQQVWKYGICKVKNGKGSIELRNKSSKIQLLVKGDQKGIYLMGESAKTLTPYCKDAALVNRTRIADEKPFEAPVFKIDSATFSGYIYGYTPRIGMKTVAIAIDDIITGKQNKFMTELATDGTFSVKLPLYYPHQVYVSSALYNGSVFLVPGKETYLMIDQRNGWFMGDCAGINAELAKLQQEIRFDYNGIQKKILDMTPDAYKTYIEASRQKDMAKIDSFSKHNLIGSKARQVQVLDIEYQYDYLLLDYTSLYQSAYRKKNKSPNLPSQQIKTDSLTAAYFSFFTNEMANNPMAVLSSEYVTFINRLKYAEILRGKAKYFTIPEMAEKLEQSGTTLTSEEKDLVSFFKQEEISAKDSTQKSFFKTHRDQIIALHTKYATHLMNLSKETKEETITYSMIEQYLLEKNVALTADEKVLIDGLKADEKTETAIKRRELQNQYEKPLANFYKDHQSFFSKLYGAQRTAARNETLEKKLGLQKGFSAEIMNAQEITKDMVENVTPVAADSLTAIQKQFTTPFIAEYIGICNRQAREKQEASKLKKDYTVNEVPKTTADKLFDAMMEKYRGKVVFVDFWATWCGPCRAGILEIKPLKEAMAKDNVVFVYITNQTSPLETYKNAIIDIKGEHFRVSDDEWNYLSSKFNITGIPHTVLVNKKGVVVNPHIGHQSNDMLRAELEKWMKE